MWVPLPLDATLPRNQRTLRPVGRLAPGATLAAADAEIKAMAAAQAKDHPDTNLNLTPRVVSTHTAITGPDTWVLLGLLAVVVVFVLLIACANLANLVLARVVRHRHDFAVRQALGASRLQLIRPLVTESLLLGLIGGLAGLGLAHAGLRLINATAHDALLQQISIDSNVLDLHGAPVRADAAAVQPRARARRRTRRHGGDAARRALDRRAQGQPPPQHSRRRAGRARALAARPLRPRAPHGDELPARGHRLRHASRADVPAAPAGQPLSGRSRARAIRAGADARGRRDSGRQRRRRS